MNKRTIGDFFVFELPNDKLSETERMRLLDSAGDFEEDVAALITEAEAVACPKILFAAMRIEERGEDYIVLNGVKLESAFLQEKTASANRVFPYIATCGLELEAWSEKYKDDVLMEYWADTIKKTFLMHPRTAFSNYLQEELQLGDKYTSLNPGSLPAWPIFAQKDLFSIFGEETIRETIGVALTPSMLMLPSKSVSGIKLPSESKFENCELCPILNCPNRKAPSKVR